MTTTENVPQGFIFVGAVVKPHGIRGELCIVSYADSPSVFQSLDTVYFVKGESAPQPRKILTCRKHHDRVLLQVEGVSSRDDAEACRELALLVREDDLPELEDEVYLYQLEGCRVVLKDSTPVGIFHGFIETPMQEVWEIRTEEGTEILLPAVPEFVLDIDIDAKLIVIDPPEGLLDLYLNPPEPKPKKPRKRPRRKKGGNKVASPEATDCPEIAKVADASDSSDSNTVS